MRRRESEGERGGLGRKGGDGRRGAAGGSEEETPSAGPVCVEVREDLRGEVGESVRRRYVRSVLGRITSETVGTGDWIPPCEECCSQMFTSGFYRKQGH